MAFASLNIDSVSDGNIANLLSNCSTVELLSLKNCSVLTELKISNRLRHLKCLSVHNCYGLRSIEICTTTLTTFEYKGHGIQFVYGETSSLTRAFMCIPDRGDFMLYALTGLSRVLPHLKTLFLDFCELHVVRVSNYYILVEFFMFLDLCSED